MEFDSIEIYIEKLANKDCSIAKKLSSLLKELCKLLNTKHIL